MTEGTTRAVGGPLIVLGDVIARKPHLTAFLQNLRQENELLDGDQKVRYAVCAEASEVAVTLKDYRDDVKMVLIGPDLGGNQITVARMLASKAHIVLVVDPEINPLGKDPETCARIQQNLEEVDIIIVLAENADEGFFQPLIKEYVLSDTAAGADFADMTPEERAQMIDKRLNAVDTFPSLPETQRKVAALDDLDPPKKWAEAIDPDLPTKTVILKILNSARYGFRSRVESIDQAVALASSKTIREIVTACQMREIFKKTSERTIDQYWRHSLAVGFTAKLLSLPADSLEQTASQKAEFDRYQLEGEQTRVLQEVGLWIKFKLGENDDTFTSGLLHDLGKITMLMCMEDSLELVMALVESEVQDAKEKGVMWAKNVIEIERFLMRDLDHQVIGERLAEEWEIDAAIRQVILHHHDVSEESPDLLKLVAFADMAANCIFPYPTTDTQHPFPVLFDRIDKAVKKSAKSGVEAVEEAIAGEIFEDLVDVMSRIQPTTHLWELVDFKSFFKMVYVIAPKIKSATIGFLQQTG